MPERIRDVSSYSVHHPGYQNATLVNRKTADERDVRQGTLSNPVSATVRGGRRYDHLEARGAKPRKKTVVSLLQELGRVDDGGRAGEGVGGALAVLLLRVRFRCALVLEAAVASNPVLRVLAE
jgi:hypothetical protein